MRRRGSPIQGAMLNLSISPAWRHRFQNEADTRRTHRPKPGFRKRQQGLNCPSFAAGVRAFVHRQSLSDLSTESCDSIAPGARASTKSL